MLKIIGTSEVDGCFLEIDEYVPFSFVCPKSASLPHLYWRTGNFRTSLIEVGINRHSGSLYSITIPLIGDVSRVTRNDMPAARNTVYGVPRFEVMDYRPLNHSDEHSPFVACAGEDDVFSWLSETQSLKTLYVSNRLSIGADRESKLCFIAFTSLSPLDMHRVTAG